MPTYLVNWEIDIEADSPEAAAKQALLVQKMGELTHFEVERMSDGKIFLIDITDESNK